jgi:RimJ/RimL family protein N-acetyltransferase
LSLPRIYQKFTTRDGRKVTLRPLRRNDLDPLLRFANALVKERKTNAELGVVSFEKRMTRKDEKEFLDRTLEGISGRRMVSVSAFDGSRMVGNCDINRRRLKDVSHTGVLGIVIMDGYRGVGLGERMIRIALHQAQVLGIWLVELDVFATNSIARRLYQRVGFKEVGTIPQKIQRAGMSIDEVTMYIHLPHH